MGHSQTQNLWIKLNQNNLSKQSFIHKKLNTAKIQMVPLEDWNVWNTCLAQVYEIIKKLSAKF